MKYTALITNTPKNNNAHQFNQFHATDLLLWDYERDQVSRKAIDIRRQGFSGPAMLNISELEYRGIVERLNRLEEKFEVNEE